MSKIDIQKLKNRIKNLDKSYDNFIKNVLGKSENKFFNSDKIVKYLGIKKKAKRTNKELKDLSANFLFKISNKKLELQYKIIESENKPSPLIKAEKSQSIDFSNYLDDIEEEDSIIRNDELKQRRNAGIALKNIPNGFIITLNTLKFAQLKKFLSELVGDNSYFAEINVNGEIRNQKNKTVNKKNIKYVITELKKIIFAYKQSAYELVQIKFIKNDDLNKDLNFPALFTGEINCIIKILKVLYPKKEHQEFLDDYEGLIHSIGCEYDNLKEITKVLKCNFMIYDKTFGKWEEIISSKNHKNIKIYVDNNHGILMLNKESEKQKYPTLETILPDEEYDHEFCNDVVESCETHNCAGRIITKILGKRHVCYCKICQRQYDMQQANLEACETCNNVVVKMQKLLAFKCDKCKKIFKDIYIFADFPEYWSNIPGEKILMVDDIPETAITCMTEVGVYFKLFCHKYRIELFNKYSPKWLREFIESALHYRPAKVYCDQEVLDEGYDHNGSYRACKSSPYWKTYGLPRNTPTMMFEITEEQNKDSKIISEILNKTGFSKIVNVNLSECHKYIQDMKLLQEQNVYTNLFLVNMLKHGASFEIRETAWCLDNIEDVEFPKNKYIANAMLGRFMTSGNNNVIESINCANENEFGHLVYKFFGDIQTVDREKKEIIYNKKIINNPNQAPHVYSYIIDYSFTQVLDKIVEVPINFLLKVKVDSIYILPEAFYHFYDIFKISDNVGDWKIEKSKRIDEASYRLQFKSCDENKPFDSFPFYIEGISDKLPIFDPFYFQLNKIHRIYGSGGTGKTYLFLKQYKLYNSVYLAPTNELVKNKSKEFGVPGFTAHDYFNLMNNGERNSTRHINIILDEAYMLSSSYMERILTSWKLKQANLFILYDDKQLPPPTSSFVNKKGVIEEVLPLTESPLFNELPKIELTKNYRFVDNLGELAEFYRNNYLTEEEIIERGDFKLIKKKKMYNEFKTEDHILTSIHRHRNAINSTLYKRRNDAEVPVMVIPENGKKKKEFTRNYAERKRGELFYVSREDYEHDQGRNMYKELTLAYANTIHCFQGKTLSEGNLYIIMDNLFEKAMFYVAISRVLRKDQIILVEP